MSLPEQPLSHGSSNDVSGPEPSLGGSAVGAAAVMTGSTPERELARQVMARQEARQASPVNSLQVGEDVLRCLRERLTLWFGEDGVNALLARATVRASEQYPILTKVRSVPHEGRQLDRLHDRPRLHEGDWVREAMVELLTMLFTLLGRLVGLDLVARLVSQVWPETPNGSGDSFDVDSAP